MRSVTLLLLAVIVSTPFSGVQAQTAPDQDYIPHRLMIRLDPMVMNKGGKSAHQVATEALGLYGLSEMKSIWKPEFDLKIASIKAKRKSLNGLDNLYAERLRNTYEVSFTADVDAKWLAAKLRNVPGIVYAEPVFLAETHEMVFPFDAFYGSPGHNYFDIQKFPQAWAVSKSDESVIIAIVDSGTDFMHEDLREKMWINKDELPSNLVPLIDTNEDGVISSRELLIYMNANNIDADGNGVVNLRDAIHPNSPFTNGQDTDGNGYIDDIIGWDFWDDGTFPSVTSDNDPAGSASNHGTHVAGTAAAHTNNGIGISGTGWNAIVMAIKAGGAPTAPRSIGFGYQGMLYAAANGAHIINNSWGGSSFSQAAADVCAFVNSLGVVIISSAGNDNRASAGYPAAYPEVLSIGSLTVSGVRSSFSNFDRDLDIFATGSSILSADLGNGYVALSGTSMSSPVVAGLAALLRHQFPDWGPERIRTQIRSTGVNIDHLNPIDAGRLGKGMIDAYAALTNIQPGITLTGAEFVNPDDEKPVAGEAVKLRLQLVNNGGPFSQAMTASVNPLPVGMDFVGGQTSIELPAMAEGESREIEFNFTLRTAGLNRFNYEKYPLLTIRFTGSERNYDDFIQVRLSDLIFDDIGNNHTRFTISSDGTIGWRDPFFTDDGVGYRPVIDGETRENVLFHGGFMLVGGNNVADNVITTNTLKKGFTVLSPFSARRGTPELGADVYATGSFNSQPTVSMNFMRTHLQTYAFDDEAMKNAIITRMTVTNTSASPIENFYVGVFNDWDIGSYTQNSTRYSDRGDFLYTYGTYNGATLYVAVASMGAQSSALAIENAYNGETTSTRFGIAFSSGSQTNNGFTDEEKALSVKAGKGFTDLDNKDVSSVVAAGPYTIASTQGVNVGFIYAWATSLEELEDYVLSVRGLSLFDVTSPGTITSNEEEWNTGVPTQTRILPAYPNPFNPSTQLSFELAQAGNVNLSVYNVLGQRVASLLRNEAYSAGRHTFTFDARHLSSGTYITVFEANGIRQSAKMTLLK